MKKVAFLLFILALASCEEDDSTTPTPTADVRDPFIGAWDCQESSTQNGNTTFEVLISKSTVNTVDIVLENLYNYGFSFRPYAQINNTANGFTIPSQIILGNTIQGNGTLLGATNINMNYTVDNGNGPDHVSAVLTKK